MKELIEIDTTFDIKGYHNSKQDDDWKDNYPGYAMVNGNDESSKLLTETREWVPYFSIGHHYGVDGIGNYHMGGYWWTNGVGKYFNNRGIITEAMQYPIGRVEELGVSEPILACVCKGLGKLWKDTCRDSGINEYGHSNRLLDILSKKELTKLALFYIRREKADVIKYITNPHMLIDVAWESSCNRWEGVWKWGDFISNIWSMNGFVHKRARGNTPAYISGPGYIARYDHDSQTTEPLVCLMIKGKYLPYYKAGLIVEDRLEAKHFQLYVKEGLDVKDTTDKNLRPKYRKYLKKVLDEAGVEIIEKKTLNDIFATYELPAMNTLQDYTKFLNNAAEEVMTFCEEENLLFY